MRRPVLVASLVAVAFLPAVLCSCGEATDRYVCEHKEKQLYYLEITSHQATVTAWDGKNLATSKIERLGEHRFVGPKGWKGSPGMMGTDMLAQFPHPADGSVFEFYRGCNLIDE